MSIDTVYLGDIAAEKVYVGDIEIWPLSGGGVHPRFLGAGFLAASAMKPSGMLGNLSGSGSFSATATAVPPGTVSDDFNRADDPTGLGAGWVIRSGAMALAGGMAHPVGATQWAYATPTTAMVSNDAEVSVTLGPTDPSIDHFMLYVGANTTGECVFAYFYQGNAYFWHQYGWSSYANIQGASYLPQAPGDTITLRRVGTVHTILKNGVDTGISINYAVIPIDSSHLLVGFGLYSDNGASWRTVDSFSARSL